MRLSPRVVTLGAVVAVTSMTASSALAAAPRLLPAKQERVTIAPGQAPGVRHALGERAPAVARRAVTAPVDGFVTARLAGPARSDWDLAVVDKATGQVLNGSAQLGSTEIATTAVRKGQALLIQSCHRTGADTTVTQSVQFTKATVSSTRRSSSSGSRSAPTSIARRSRR